MAAREHDAAGDPERFIAGGGDADVHLPVNVRRAGEAFRAALPLDGVGPSRERLQRIHDVIVRGRPRWSARRRLVVGLATAVMLINAAAFARTLAARYFKPPQPAPAVVPAPARQDLPRVALAPTTSASATIAPAATSAAAAAPEVALPRAPARTITRARSVDLAPALAPLPAASPSPAPVVKSPPDASLLHAALAKLRQDKDPAAALTILDRHRTELGGGDLAEEATLLRLEALLAVPDRSAALALLEGQALASHFPSRRDLPLLRAELRASAGRCRQALADFAAARRPGLHDETDERAAYGRAVCLAELSDRPAARAAFDEYLALYPRGRFAPQAASSR